MLVPEYFKDSELKCQCGCGAMPKEDAVKQLYALRLLFGYPIPINSGARCADYNTRIGGSKDSYHITGAAFDCAVLKDLEWRFIHLAQLCGFRGIGIKDNHFIHIDTRMTPAVWTYK